MMFKTLRSLVAALVIAGMAVTAVPRPAQADSTSTILITAAAVAAIATMANVAHKNQLANTVQGYLQDGSVVYADGRVVTRTGQSWYPGNYGQTIACNGQQCYIQGGNVGYNGAYSGYGNNGSYPPGYGYGNGNGGYYPPGYGNGGYPPGYGNGGYYPPGYGNGGYYPPGYGTGTTVQSNPFPPAPVQSGPVVVRGRLHPHPIAQAPIVRRPVHAAPIRAQAPVRQGPIRVTSRRARPPSLR